MSEISVEHHVTYALRNAQVRKWPFSHFYAENVFPDYFYWRMCDELKVKSDFERGAKDYNGRTFSTFGHVFPELGFLNTPEFARHVIHIFESDFAARFPDGGAKIGWETRLVRDGEGYCIGPHTDASWKLVSLLFYLPIDGWRNSAGTSLYVPRDPKFRCPGGPHHEFEDFERVYTAPYIPNTCVGFFKTNDSFHGVERIEKPMQRDVLLYNLYVGNVKSGASDLNRPAEQP